MLRLAASMPRLRAPLMSNVRPHLITFSVYSGDTLVGHSKLERGDPPMGVAFGVLSPTDAYTQIQHECMTNHADQSALRLSARTQAGAAVECEGVGILDYSGDLETPYAEVNVLGISGVQYAELFPGHVERYERRFDSNSLPK